MCIHTRCKRKLLQKILIVFQKSHIQILDIVNYFLYAPSPLTKEQLKVYKSLEPCNYFVCGWVKDVGVKLFKENMLLHGRVSYIYIFYFI